MELPDIRALPERLREKIYIEPNSGCWLWLGAWNENGYGRVAKNTYGEERVHRLVWRICMRAEPPPMLHHWCKKRWCCNPNHLQAKTGHIDHALEHFQIYCKSGRHLMAETRSTTGGRKQCRECYNESMRRYRRKNPVRIAAMEKKRYLRVKADPEAYKRRFGRYPPL